MSVTDAADALGVSAMTVYRRVRSGTWPAARAGRKWLVSQAFVSAVTEMIKAGGSFVIEDFAARWMTENTGRTEASA